MPYVEKLTVKYKDQNNQTVTEERDIRDAETAAEVSELKSQINQLPKLAETEENTADLYIADADGYVVAQFSDGHIQTKNFNSAVIDLPVEYKFSGSDLLIGFGYNGTHDAVVVLNVGRPNNLFDFAGFKLKAKGTSLKDLETANLTTVWTSGTDMHSPFQFLAVNDADGYYASATDPSYTGGAHTQTINGNSVQTASSKYVHAFADGRPVSSGFGRCNHFEIRWANNVQAYNCVKADGTGRTSMVEYHDMIFDGVCFDEQVMLVPSEAIKMKYWEGFAFVSWGTTYKNIRFVDATNKVVYTSADSTIKSGNAATSGMVIWGDSHALQMTVDTNIDLGRRDYYAGDAGAYISSTKGYFHIIQKTSPFVEMTKDSGYYLHGTFRFYPVVS